MMFALKPRACKLSGLTVTQTPDGLGRILDSDCAGVILNRQPQPGFQAWIDALHPDELPSARVELRVREVRRGLTDLCDDAGTPDCAHRAQLIANIGDLADHFAKVMRISFLRLRVDKITHNACRKFHVDALTARLICTYRGTGTQYGEAYGAADPKRVFTTPTGAPIMLRGSLWPVNPSSNLLHRSPPIEGYGQTRFVLVLDPVLEGERFL